MRRPLAQVEKQIKNMRFEQAGIDGLKNRAKNRFTRVQKNGARGLPVARSARQSPGMGGVIADLLLGRLQQRGDYPASRRTCRRAPCPMALPLAKLRPLATEQGRHTTAYRTVTRADPVGVGDVGKAAINFFD